MLPLKNWFNRLTDPSRLASRPDSHLDGLQLDNEAIVIEAIAPGKTGWVHFQSTSWLAWCASGAQLPVGQHVYVVNRHNTMLYVEPTSKAVDLDAISVFWIGF